MPRTHPRLRRTCASCTWRHGYPPSPFPPLSVRANIAPLCPARPRPYQLRVLLTCPHPAPAAFSFYEQFLAKKEVDNEEARVRSMLEAVRCYSHETKCVFECRHEPYALHMQPPACFAHAAGTRMRTLTPHVR